MLSVPVSVLGKQINKQQLGASSGFRGDSTLVCTRCCWARKWLNITFFINCSFHWITGSLCANYVMLYLFMSLCRMNGYHYGFTHIFSISYGLWWFSPSSYVEEMSFLHYSAQIEHHSINVVSLQILRLMACTELLLQIFLWDIYNTAEVLQVESLMNNGGASVFILFICCVDTDTVAALLMGPRPQAVFHNTQYIIHYICSTLDPRAITFTLGFIFNSGYLRINEKILLLFLYWLQ